MTLTTASLARWLAAATASAMCAYGLARQSAVAIATRNAGAAHLRLSWMARPERIERCRALSDKELREREEHMRQRLECEGRSATYQLLVTVDAQEVANTVVRGGGLRHDRPIHLLREFPVDPGTRRLRVSMTRVERAQENVDSALTSRASDADTGLFAGRAERERVEHDRRARAAIPARLLLDTTLVFANGGVVLVTLDAERRALQLVTSASTTAR